MRSTQFPRDSTRLAMFPSITGLQIARMTSGSSCKLHTDLEPSDLQCPKPRLTIRPAIMIIAAATLC